MQTKIATLASLILLLVLASGCCSTSTTTRTERDSTYTITPEVVQENDIPGLGTELFHGTRGWSNVPLQKGDLPTPVVTFHKDKTRTAKQITAIYNPADSTLSLVVEPKDTSATSHNSDTQTTVTKSPFLDWLLRPLGLTLLVVIVLVFLYLIFKVFMASANPLGSAASGGSSIINSITNIFKKK